MYNIIGIIDRRRALSVLKDIQLLCRTSELYLQKRGALAPAPALVYSYVLDF